MIAKGGAEHCAAACIKGRIAGVLTTSFFRGSRSFSMMLAISSLPAHAGDALQVFVVDRAGTPPLVLYAAQRTAARLLSDAGIRLDGDERATWTAGNHCCRLYCTKE
jgi:hypothetical protein